MTRFLTAAAIVALWASPGLAQDNEEGRGSDQGAESEALGASTEGFLASDGETLYMTACAGCHQPQGQGAVGAARYPPLSGNERLEGARYPTWIVLNGMGAMPPFGDWLDDEQVVAVVQFVQQNLGNDYDSELTADAVAGLRDAPAP